MWYERTKEGHYKYRERFLDPFTGKYFKVSVTLNRKNKKEAEETLARLAEKKIASKKDIDYKLSEVVDFYLQDQKSTVKASTYKRNYFACVSIERILGGDVLVNNLTASYIRQALLATGENKGTLNERITRLKAMLRWAYRNNYIKSLDCVDKLERFKNESRKADLRFYYLEADELNMVLKSMNAAKWRMLTKFLALSGLRIGEAMALTVSDIDFKNRVIKVTKTYDYNNNVTTTPKTNSSIRDVYIQDELMWVVKSLIKGAKKSHSELLFWDSEMGHMHYPAYRKYLKVHVEEVTGRKVSPHVLRHTHASLLMQSGMDIDLIQRRLGHENSDVTKRIYAHVTKVLQKKDNNSIKNINLLSK